MKQLFYTVDGPLSMLEDFRAQERKVPLPKSSSGKQDVWRQQKKSNPNPSYPVAAKANRPRSFKSSLSEGTH